MSASVDNGVRSFLAAAEHELGGAGDSAVSDAEIEQVLTAAVRLYAQRAESTGAFPAPLSRDRVNATEVLTVTREMIRIVDVNIFDVSMWYRRSR